jgi:hypothetical protein
MESNGFLTEPQPSGERSNGAPSEGGSMRKYLASALAAAVLATGSVQVITPAEAQSRSELRAERNYYMNRFCSRHPRDRDCVDWRRHGHTWSDTRYRDWYQRRHRGSDNTALAAIFGLATGAILGGAITGGFGGPGYAVVPGGRDVTAHVRACQARYRSYDPSTNTFLGYDGRRHLCRL